MWLRAEVCEYIFAGHAVPAYASLNARTRPCVHAAWVRREVWWVPAPRIAAGHGCGISRVLHSVVLSWDIARRRDGGHGAHVFHVHKWRCARLVEGVFLNPFKIGACATVERGRPLASAGRQLLSMPGTAPGLGAREAWCAGNVLIAEILCWAVAPTRAVRVSVSPVVGSAILKMRDVVGFLKQHRSVYMCWGRFVRTLVHSPNRHLLVRCVQCGLQAQWLAGCAVIVVAVTSLNAHPEACPRVSFEQRRCGGYYCALGSVC